MESLANLESVQSSDSAKSPHSHEHLDTFPAYCGVVLFYHSLLEKTATVVAFPCWHDIKRIWLFHL